jgi:hypothetical protein
MKNFIGIILTLSLLSACGTSGNELLTVENNLNTVQAQATKKVRLITEKKPSPGKTPVKNSIAKRLPEGGVKMAEPLNIMFDAPVLKNSTSDHISVIRVAFDSMNKSQPYEAASKIAQQAAQLIRDDLLAKNDPDVQMRNLLSISLAGTQNSITWESHFKVLSIGLSYVLERGFNNAGNSLSPQDLATVAIRMVNAASTFENGYYVGLVALKIFRDQYPQYNFIADNAIKLTGNRTWQDAQNIEVKALDEIRKK